MIRQLFRPAPSAPNIASPAPQIAPQIAPQAAPQAAAGPDSLTQMMKVIGGDLSGLSTGDRLMALSGLLRSATRSGRRAGLTPQRVLNQIQQQQLGQIQGQMQVEKLRKDRQTAAAIQKYKDRLATLAKGGEITGAMLRTLGQEAIASGDIEMGLRFIDQSTSLDPEPRNRPLTRERYQGNEVIQEQLNLETNEYEEIGRGPRFAPRGPGVTVNVGDQEPVGARVFEYVNPETDEVGFVVNELYRGGAR